MKKLKLHGFNNLTKSLSFCIYDICYAKTAEERDGYIAYIDELYNANRLTEILTETCSIIGANILNIAKKDSLFVAIIYKQYQNNHYLTVPYQSMQCL